MVPHGYGRATSGKEIARITHDGPVNSVAFSPNGKYVVSGSEDGTAVGLEGREQ